MSTRRLADLLIGKETPNAYIASSIATRANDFTLALRDKRIEPRSSWKFQAGIRDILRRSFARTMAQRKVGQAIQVNIQGID